MGSKDFAERANTQNFSGTINLIIALQFFGTLLLGASASPDLTTLWLFGFIVVFSTLLNSSLFLR